MSISAILFTTLAVAMIGLLVYFANKIKNKIIVLALLVLVVLSYFSFLPMIEGENMDFQSAEGVKESVGLYFSWLGTVFNDAKTFTGNTINSSKELVNKTESTLDNFR
jgi:hypothetical protein